MPTSFVEGVSDRFGDWIVRLKNESLNEHTMDAFSYSCEEELPIG